MKRINAILIDDELTAVQTLRGMLAEFCPMVNVIQTANTIDQAVQAVEQYRPEVVFLDIEMPPHGTGFDFLHRTEHLPYGVIFTTAYDSYALRAFQVNSVDYILKPVDQDDLARAFSKLRQLRTPAALDADILQKMMQALQPRQFKDRFMVKVGDHLTAIDAGDIDFFFGENKIVWLRHQNKRKYPVDYTLDQLEDMLDPSRFFRLNRQYITAIDAITDVVSYSNSRLKVRLKEPLSEGPILISREKVEAFKTWMGK